ncbi:cactin [Zerene cesonia]|uniref:cactin n=1 Tax=Zerene cesonia TaxID=33412 RepID=UPI0018E5A0F4|nr:cactin [Zerene cesonia]
MSSKIARHRERSRSRSVEHRREHKSRSRDRSRSTSKKSKHRSISRERKSKHKKIKKKKRDRSSSSSSSTSDSDAEELKLLQRLEAERQRLKEEKRKQKEQLKANETPEEKRARRLREKQEKERKRRERMGWDNEYQCYTNQDNPFGDSALTNTFVWSKKLAKEGVKTVSRDELEALNRQKQLENKIELEKVKQRRLEREAERAAREAEAAAAARAREAAQFHSWARQEDAFHLHQARLRSQIRIRDGRAKPIDLLAWYVSSEQCVDALEMHEPYTYLNGLQANDLEDLLEDIKVYKELEREEQLSYWEDVETIVSAELGQLRRLAEPRAARDGVHHAVAPDVQQIFKGKTGAQLEALQQQISQKISGQRAGVDVGYWETLLAQLKAHMARARLRDRHQENLRRKLQLLKSEQGVRPPAGQPAGQPASSAEVKQEEASEKAEAKADSAKEDEGDGDGDEDGGDGEGEGEGGEGEGEEWCVREYVRGRYSPAPLAAAALEPATLLTEPSDDANRLAYLRASLTAKTNSAGPLANVPTGTGALEAAARRAMDAEGAGPGGAGGAGPAGGGGNAAQFSVEHALPDQPYLWADKYRPRKPRYFNRVHTGFEWNKYNQTHYDMDNPPPKIVQGYKFNIFYPDLIDKNATPQFSLVSQVPTFIISFTGMSVCNPLQLGILTHFKWANLV